MKWHFVLCAAAGAALAFLSDTAAAFINPCAIPPSVYWSPGHPGPADVVQLSVLAGFLGGYGPYVRLAVDVRPGNVIFVDALLLPSDVDVPGYRANSWTAGPFAPGDYAVNLSVRTYDPSSGATSYPCAIQNYAQTLSVGAVAGAVGIAPVVEFYNAALDHYFITQDPTEIADLDHSAHVGWQRTGQSFPAYVSGRSDGRGVPVRRFYAATSRIDSHFFTPFDSETAVLLEGNQLGVWHLETLDAFEMILPNSATGQCPAMTTPVYRLWNGRADSNHRYTTDRAARDAMVARGYVAEGAGPDAVTMCAPATQ